ncbi:hypothetical protein [Cryptosporangium phraense]|uniref:Uncharacterized protein n=1 Tax=Cryptosporangium phraense TaxID=2593070 RepID=A0A545AVR6_9ACTN|nr:hypothetical protein [Cryptosporangium phraense]TQS45410.1 hypothetical protein FL583_10030 [Cryptosporangium phraense]
MHVGKLLYHLDRRPRSISRARPLATAPAAAAATVTAAMTTAGRVAGPLEDEYLARARAAGHDPATIDAFADTIRGKPDDWLREHLTILDLGRTGPVTFRGQPLKQFDETTCGTTSVQVARILADPVYALSLTADDDPAAFGQRLIAEQQRLHRSTNRLWPQWLGTSPWGAGRGLAREAGYRATIAWVDDTDPESVRGAARAVREADRPVPLLVGNLYPAHYLLVVARLDDRLRVYNPAPGRLSDIPADRLDLGNATAFRHLHGVLLPTP